MMLSMLLLSLLGIGTMLAMIATLLQYAEAWAALDSEWSSRRDASMRYVTIRVTWTERDQQSRALAPVANFRAVPPTDRRHCGQRADA